MPATLYEESWRDFVFAEVWSRPGLERRARFLIAIAGATMNDGATDHLERYLRGALSTGDLSLAELREAALQVAVYGGWSKGEALDRAVTKVAGDLGLRAVTLPPICAAPWDAAERNQRGAAEFIKVTTFPGGPPATPLMEAINNFVFGELWIRPGLDHRSRRWLTLACVCDSGAETPVKTHVHAAMAAGNCRPEEMPEFVLQFAIHGGWPKASIVHSVVIEMIKKVAAGLPWNG
jgi:4-carboxymuconolactone decarboxylase